MSTIQKVEILKDDPGDCDMSFKIIIIGDSYVGKSCLTIKAIKGVFEEDYSSTVGFEFMTLFLKLNDNCLKLQLWDTCGQEAYRSIISSFYKSSALAILVYSIDKLETFSNLEIWLNEIRTKSNPNIIIYLIGNKVDLEDQRQVTKEMAKKFCENNDINFFVETSAKTGINVEYLFIEAAKTLYNQHMKYKTKFAKKNSLVRISFGKFQDQKMDNNDEEPRKKSCCE